MKNKLFTPAVLLLPLWFGLNTNPLENKRYNNAVSPFSIFMYSTSHKSDLPGETVDSHYAGKNALEIIDFELSNVQNLYLNQGVGLGSSQKAEGNSITFRTEASRAIPALYTALVTGFHYGDIFIEMVTLPTNTQPLKIYDKIELRLVMVESVKAAGVDKNTGQTQFEVTIRYGAIKRTLTDYDQMGIALTPTVVTWSYVKNNNSLDI